MRPDALPGMVKDELSRRFLCKVQDARIQKRTRCWCQEPMWLCSVLLCKPFPGKLGMESFIASLPSGSNSSQEWKIPTQTCTRVDSLWQHTLVLPPHPPSHLTSRPSLGSEEEEEPPSTFIGSSVGPKN